MAWSPRPHQPQRSVRFSQQLFGGYGEHQCIEDLEQLLEQFPAAQTIMAARLVKRCQCLLRESAHLAPAGPPAGRLRLASLAHKTLTTLTSSATSPISHFPASLSQRLEKEQMFTPSPECQEVNELIKKATRPEERLELLGGSHCLH
ncbi:hypothetical protein QTO34_000616 [Cnephaeus nilssonii]|uniref:Uncharacterized protein n=1 Tax=Cnephaeus nilssonii TaxID=3371016 RepID=A0AA40LUJ1_CNENI|nr:hypothetical protein QTO34_000616 [Eptesicus nilssonii]